jgi:hypothetical protein
MTQAGEAPRTAADDRPTSLRLARVHLRLGSLALARAELEALSSRGRLDDDGLLDLAEARWRTGDLSGAGDAAVALVDRGRDDLIALVIAAEAVAAAGRPSEARRLANRAMETTGEPLDALFAGMPRSSIWPADETDVSDVMAAVAADLGTVAAESASPAAVEAYAGGRAALAAGDATQASLRLAVALRLEPAFAEPILEAVGAHADEPGMALVAGDALRLLGRETEARAAYDVARGAPSTPSAATPSAATPAGGTPDPAAASPDGGLSGAADAGGDDAVDGDDTDDAL